MRQRKARRLQEYDYAQNGYYFVTVCARDRREWFGKIENGKIMRNEYGNIVLECWNDLPNHYMNAKLDEFIIMPNHLHGIIVIENNVVNGFKPFTTNHGLSEIVRGLKTFSSRRINETINDGDRFRWQKSFYDHVIRDEHTLQRIREYIVNNPLSWELDIENLENLGQDTRAYYNQIINAGGLSGHGGPPLQA